MIEARELADFLAGRFGLAIIAESRHVSNGQSLLIRPCGVEHTIGFTIEIVVGWRSLEAEFKLGLFAANLVNSMRTASPEQRSAFRTFAASITGAGASLPFLINGARADPVDTKTWPESWDSLELKMRKGALVLESDKPIETKNTVFLWTARFVGLALSLLPLEAVDERELYSMNGVKEGKVTYETVKKYERSRINRAACIEIQGVDCKVCGMTFCDKYGTVGGGFIHVHHVEPVSLLGGDYVIDPAVDLVPVCPNCHAMLHKKSPPYTIEEMRSIIAKNLH